MILVDTSVWIDHLRVANMRLAALLHDGQVCCHPFVIGELACGHLRRRGEFLSLLANLPQIAVMSDEQVTTRHCHEGIARQCLVGVVPHKRAPRLRR